MKKFLLLALLGLFSLGITAQEGFSAKAGYNSVSFDLGEVSVSEGGFYIGAGYQFELSDQFDIEPSVLYSLVEDVNALMVPIMAKYKVSEEFNVQAGPQVNHILEDGFDEAAFGLDIAIGVGYNISEQFFAEARYGFQVVRDVEGVDVNTLSIGVGYRF